ncbi:hypothetical protein P171DRAFT_432551 [Karstenula rhodostoma CBS 690.94]|uniref:Uncharacterized protein n=1 Tax=Karstenula rhodostoma CBS 690.94 TaxID=1392251 RepID=A0A9P4PGB6_9PLEO|nr:hypothetical protein P171DRAFT_432551 [Karstenula rhodostoma CBS 690.94]
MNGIQLSHHAGACVGHCRAQRREMDISCGEGVAKEMAGSVCEVQGQKGLFVRPIVHEERWEFNGIQTPHHAWAACVGHCRAQRHEMDASCGGGEAKGMAVAVAVCEVQMQMQMQMQMQVGQKGLFVRPIAQEERWEGRCHVPLQMDTRIDSK